MTTSRPLLRRTLQGCLAGLLAACAVHAAEAPEPLFEPDTELAITLEADWDRVVRDREDGDRHPAVLAYIDAAGREHRIPATVETRGITRLRICKFPPLRLRFRRDATRGTEFEGQRSLKMVTHCRVGSTYEQYYVQELLAYRINNRITPHSFRVRPLQVTYLAPDGAADDPRFAFLIEDNNDVARRNGHRSAQRLPLSVGDYDQLALTRFMLFQYLIGNTDWAVLASPGQDECCHNIRVTAPQDGSGMVPLPYDFDSSGMVAARYAAPDPRLPIKFVTERLYRGFCAHNPGLEPVRGEFLAGREAILALVRDAPRLSPRRERILLDYFNEFYAILENPARFEREVIRKCRR